MNPEQLILDAVERGKALGYAEGMRAMRVKELTDEEIIAIAHDAFEKYKNWHHYQIEFARAILRKAQEK
jgi:hypothetical protein